MTERRIPMIKWSGWRKIDFDGSLVIIGVVILLCVAIFYAPRGKAFTPPPIPVMTEGEYRLAMIELQKERNDYLNDIAVSLDNMPDYVLERLGDHISPMFWKGEK